MRPDIDFCSYGMGRVKPVGSTQYRTLYCFKPAVAWYLDERDDVYSSCERCSTLACHIGPAVSREVAAVFALMRS